MLAKTPLRTLAIKWLQEQDPDQGYDWNNGTQCACAQLAKSLNRYYEWRDFIDCACVGVNLAEWKNLNIVAGGYRVASERTFGKFLERLLLQEE